MASYKVPQDVEADDKLIGPFSFRQFIYLIIVALSGFLAWGLAQLFIGLAIIPLPVIIFFGALALPLRKDQPMEIYMAALVSFYLKPRQRKWDPEGIESLIEISAPKNIEIDRTKGISQNEAEQRLSYLANIVDSGGWAIRGSVGGAASSTTMNTDIILEAQGATDVLDTTTGVAQNFDQMMAQSTERLKEEARERMLQATMATPQPATSIPVQDPAVQFNPYPNIHQSVIQPINDTAHQVQTTLTPPPAPAPQPNLYTQIPAAQSTNTNETASTTSDTPVSAGIMNLANNSDLSIETIAHEAERLKKKASEESEEVVISLR